MTTQSGFGHSLENLLDVIYQFCDRVQQIYSCTVGNNVHPKPDQGYYIREITDKNCSNT